MGISKIYEHVDIDKQITDMWMLEVEPQIQAQIRKRITIY